MGRVVASLLMNLAASGCCFSVLSPVFLSPATAQVVPSGATATSVSAGANGRQQVGIAPITSNGISHNTYSSFSVPAAGVDLNNRVVGASTIVNEVTASNRTFLNGPLEVLGSRAHVVLVNPNGITVDGGSFINTGGVSLSTGTVRYGASTTTPGQTNTFVTTGAGDILVGSGGLSGNMSALHLLAGKIKIDGPVVNSHASPQAIISALAGNSELELNSAVVPGSTLQTWTKRRDLGGASSEILVDVTPNGLLSASRVSVAVSARGAGVSYAGKGLASIGDFRIDATGKVGFTGAQIRAEKAVRVQAASIDVLNAPGRISKLESLSGALTLLADDGNIDLRGQVTGVVQDGTDARSLGAVTLHATGDIKLLTENADNLAIAFASQGALVAKAGGTIENNTGRLLSNSTVTISTPGTFKNIIDVVGTGLGEPQVSYARKGNFWQSLWLKHRKYTRVYTSFGQLRLPEKLAYVAGSSVMIDTGEVINSGEIDALTGAMTINTVNLKNLGVQTGWVEYTKRCGIVCTSKGAADISVYGGQINSAQGMRINATGSILNDAGLIVSYGNMELLSPVITAKAAFVPSYFYRPAGLYDFFVGSKATLVQVPNGGQFLAPIGTIEVSTGAPVIIDGGELYAGNGVINPAGEIVRVPHLPISPIGKQHIGLLRDWIR